MGEGAVWVFDTEVLKLHRIDKSDLSLEETVDLSGDIPKDSFTGSIQLKAGTRNVYVINANNGSDASDFLAVDKSSLDVTELHSAEEILAGVAINDDILLYENVGRGVFALDGTSGEIVASYTIVFDDDLTIWVP